mmetsp:Transcript_78644/g.218361  ORF Transcript_78644/g.218361 Transcript_78644/m.218361 type:complete len:157 (+) Transcript_78644:102-572(+)
MAATQSPVAPRWRLGCVPWPGPNRGPVSVAPPKRSPLRPAQELLRHHLRCLELCVAHRRSGAPGTESGGVAGVDAQRQADGPDSASSSSKKMKRRKEEFMRTLRHLMKVKDPSDLSESRMHRCWREVDASAKGRIAFEEFVVWYLSNFASTSEPGG